MTPLLRVALVALVFATPAAAADLGWSPWGVEPTVLFRVEALQVGVGPSVHASTLNLDIEWHRLRLGVSAFELYGGASVLPVRIGCTIFDRPRNYGGRLFGKLPEVYVQAAVHHSIWNDPPPYYNAGELSVAAAVDYFGVGAVARVGVVAFSECRTADRLEDIRVTPFIGLQLRFASLCAGF